MILSFRCLACSFHLILILLVVKLVSCSPILLALVEITSPGWTLLQERLDSWGIGQLIRSAKVIADLRTLAYNPLIELLWEVRETVFVLCCHRRLVYSFSRRKIHFFGSLRLVELPWIDIVHLNVDVTFRICIVTPLGPRHWNSRRWAHNRISIPKLIHYFCHQALSGHLFCLFGDAFSC